MKNNQKLIVAGLVLLIIIAGVYVYGNSGDNSVIENVSEMATGTDKEIVATTSISELVKNPTTLSSVEKCESEIKKDIVNLSPALIGVSFVEIKAFNSATLAKDFLFSRGYTNKEGRGLADITAAGNTNDFSVGIIAFESELPDKQDDKKLVTMRLTQPVVCINGVIASNSKTFLNTTLKNEAGVRAALYQSGEVVN